MSFKCVEILYDVHKFCPNNWGGSHLSYLLLAPLGVNSFVDIAPFITKFFFFDLFFLEMVRHLLCSLVLYFVSTVNGFRPIRIRWVVSYCYKKRSMCIQNTLKIKLTKVQSWYTCRIRYRMSTGKTIRFVL